MTSLSLLVLYVSNLDASRDFYTGLGLDLVREQRARSRALERPARRRHGAGAYPAGGGVVTRTRLLLRVPGAAESAAEDPDGNLVVVLAP